MCSSILLISFLLGHLWEKKVCEPYKDEPDVVHALSGDCAEVRKGSFWPLPAFQYALARLPMKSLVAGCTEANPRLLGCLFIPGW